MKTLICVVFLLFASSLADNCFDGDLYVFTQGYAFYQVNSEDGSVSPNNISTNCYPIGATTNNGNNAIISCIDRNSDNTFYMTVAENKIVSSINYNLPCSTNLIAYDGKHSKNIIDFKTHLADYIWAYYLRQYYYNSTNGWNEGTVVALDAATGNVVSNVSFEWYKFKFVNPVPVTDNGTCTIIVNGQYSFIAGESLYVVSSSSVAEIDIGNGTADFVKKFSVGPGSGLQGWTYDSKNQMVYAVASNDLYQFSIANSWEYSIVNSDFPSLSTSSLATMDVENSNYLVFTSTGFNGYDEAI